MPLGIFRSKLSLLLKLKEEKNRQKIDTCVPNMIYYDSEKRVVFPIWTVLVTEPQKLALEGALAQKKKVQTNRPKINICVPNMICYDLGKKSSISNMDRPCDQTDAKTASKE